MYQLSLVVATATVSYTYAPGTVRVYLFSRFFFKCHIQGAHKYIQGTHNIQDLHSPFFNKKQRQITQIQVQILHVLRGQKLQLLAARVHTL